ncbi:MAG: 3-oxoacyl-ACP synthase III [Pirellulales bacterium]|nr:3-oxoacyl-ACP synthase III [Pirellulales bacterium]
MRYRKVYLESFGYTLPDEVVTTDALERRLSPVYERLQLPHGRLELMTGIRERRFFPPATSPGSISTVSGEKAIVASGIDRQHIGALIHGSVCRDFLEPATACSVHHNLSLTTDCQIYDVSNACLGLLTGMVQIANMIELGQIRAGLVVGTECGRHLVDSTIARLNTDLSLTRQSIKHLIASLTIGSGSAAVLLCDEQLSQTRNQVSAAGYRAHTEHHHLCHSEGLESFMHTDSQRLMHEGVATGAETFVHFLSETGWRPEEIDKTVCHQVGVAQRKMLFEKLALDPIMDYTTLETLGNTGAAALPLTMALALENTHICSNDRVAMMGIGSGINCLMIGVHWQESRVLGQLERGPVDTTDPA